MKKSTLYKILFTVLGVLIIAVGVMIVLVAIKPDPEIDGKKALKQAEEAAEKEKKKAKDETSGDDARVGDEKDADSGLTEDLSGDADDAESPADGGQKNDSAEEEDKDDIETVAPRTDLEPPSEESLNGFTFETRNDFVKVQEGVNIRPEATTDCEAIAKLEKEEILNRVAYNEEWTQIVFNNRICFCATHYTEDYTGDTSELRKKAEEEAKAADQAGTEPSENEGREDKEGDSSNGEKSASAPAGTIYGSGGKLIVIDPGHQTKGMNDKEPLGPGSSEMKAKVSSGTVSCNDPSRAEYKINLKVALKLKDALLAEGYRVAMTRETNDVTISNVERTQMANDLNADAYIRIHCNSSNDSSVHGIMTICQTKSNQFSGDLYSVCRKLSDCILDACANETGEKNRGVWETDTMTGLNWTEVPQTILEMGFMSNPDEDRLLADSDYQDKMVQGIVNGMNSFFG